MAFDFLNDAENYKSAEQSRIGITMVLDKTLPLSYANNLMKIAGNYIDFIKFGWGTSILYNEDIFQDKINVYKSFNIEPYCGGTLFEIAIIKNKIDDYFNHLKKYNINTIEISDGSIDLSLEKKLYYISKAKDYGFTVLSEVGKKDVEEDKAIDLDLRIEMIKSEIKAGSDFIILESRESGKGIGVYDSNGIPKVSDVEEIVNKTDYKKLIWEAPLKNQQVYFIKKLGIDVNLGNINPDEAISLETIRRGFRGDTIDLLF
jgi:phosphosulfolactate synthase